MQKRRILTGITTSGTPHLGNYVGAIRPAIAASRRDDAESFYFLADYHALIKCGDPARVQQSTLEIAASWLACGLDPDRVLFYRQSDIPEIPELTWLLTCVTAKGLLNRAHAYKAAVDQNVAAGEDPDAGVTAGLYMYPVLMAADILLYQTDIVPVGDDQKQHVELTRDLAERFNSRYGDTFKVPNAVIQQDTARIYDLQNPTAKMSKSAESDAGVLWLLDEPSKSAKKIMRAVTDSEGSVRYDRENKPGVSNLLVIYAALTGRQIPAIEDEYAGRGYGDFKKGLAEVVVDEFGPVRERALELLADPAELDRVLAANAARADEVADATLADVYGKVGLLRRV